MVIKVDIIEQDWWVTILQNYSFNFTNLIPFIKSGVLYNII